VLIYPGQMALTWLRSDVRFHHTSKKKQKDKVERGWELTSDPSHTPPPQPA
jgi:hypothetical protein